MGSALDFLFQGQAPNVTTGGADTSTSGPLWLQQQYLNLTGAAANLAQQGTPTFPGPQVAAPSAQTTQAQQLAGQNVGSWSPYLTQAGALTRAASAPITGSDISQFLNPYQDYVTGALNRNLQRNILPGVQDKFVSAGQSRSPQEAQLTGEAIYGTQQAAGQALAGGYQGALNSLLQQRQQQMAGAGQLGNLGALTQAAGVTDVGQLAAAGQGQDTLAQANINAALNNFQQQQQWPYQQLGFLSNILNRVPLNAVGQNTQSTTGASGSPGPSPLAQLASVAGTGQKLGVFSRGGPVRSSVRPAPPVRGALSTMRMAA